MLDMVRNIFDPSNSFYEFGRKLIYYKYSYYYNGSVYGGNEYGFSQDNK